MEDTVEQNGLQGQRADISNLKARHTSFETAFSNILDLADLCFGDAFHPENRSEHVCQILGSDCRHDFNEILHLANGNFYRGCVKLTRTLYERSITLATIAYTSNPVEMHEIATRFTDFQWIDWGKAHSVARQQYGPDADAIWNASVPDPSSKRILAELRRVRPLIQIEKTHTCSNCGETKTTLRDPHTWYLTIDQMARKLGGNWLSYYLTAFTIPNTIIHPTAMSFRDSLPELPAIQSMWLLMDAIKAQNYLAELNLYDKIGSANRAIDELSIEIRRYAEARRELRSPRSAEHRLV